MKAGYENKGETFADGISVRPLNLQEKAVVENFF